MGRHGMGKSLIVYPIVDKLQIEKQESLNKVCIVILDCFQISLKQVVCWTKICWGRTPPAVWGRK